MQLVKHAYFYSFLHHIKTYMNEAFSAVHLMLKLKRNNEPRLSKGINMSDPFFSNIDDTYKEIVEKCKNKRVEERIFPYIGGDDDFREINYRPFNNAVKLTASTVLPEDNNVSYIIDNLNTDWALSAVEQLTNIYKNVTIYRLYTHMPFKLKFVINCAERLNDNVGPLMQSVDNKINAGELYTFMRTAQEWTRSMIWAAETGEDTYVSSDILKLYYKLMSDLLEEL